MSFLRVVFKSRLAAFVDFQDYESPDEAVVAALKK